RRRYAYRLLGFDEAWVETPASRRLASYTNLPPGQYTLQLRSAPPRGAWEAPSSIAVRVAPRWYESTAAHVAAGLLLLAVLAGMVQVRTLVLRRVQRRLEALVVQRTAE